MFIFTETYEHSLRESLIGNTKCFASWLWHFWDRIEAASRNDEISVRTFKEGVLMMIKPAAPWRGKDGFICDVYDYTTKAQILERCQIAILNARKIKNIT